MSCFIHDDRSFDVLFATLNAMRKRGELSAYVKCREFVACLREYNHKAFDERYSESTEVEPWEPKTEIPIGALACFKLLSSIDYQCIDSTEYCTSQIRKDLDEVKTCIADSYFNNIPEYRVAPWSYNDSDRTEIISLSDMINGRA